MLNTFQIATLTPGLLQPSIAIATHRAGGLAILDFEYVRDEDAAVRAIDKLNQVLPQGFGVKLSGATPGLIARLSSRLPSNLKTVVFTCSDPKELGHGAQALREKSVSILLEARCLEHAQIAAALGFSGVIAKGHEAGGRVANETTFVLLQRFKTEVQLPVWVQGGIGLHTAAACVVGGAAGLVLDSQLALTRESCLPEPIKAKIASMDGSETVCLGEQLGEAYRMYFRPGHTAVKALGEIETRLAVDDRQAEEVLESWREAIVERAGWESEQKVLMLGQDAAFAASLAQRFRTVAGVLQAMRDAVRTHCENAERLRPLDENSAMARSHGTRYPILQGPMTRVSDVPEFAGRVAEEGALPFLALALMRGPEVEALLAETQIRLRNLPWGVGILGFVPAELREEQMEVVRKYRPPFALIAGGRPDQARTLESNGIISYLHVPSPGLLQMFVQQGARRFVFEGRECGGHVGPRASFVLWNQMVDVLLNAPALDATPEDFHVVFAGGIHDALSAAMVSVIAAPLAERGVRVGVLLGTAYLFTQEAVASGAIREAFQEQAQKCSRTVLLETGPGHATRCVDTPYLSAFVKEKKRLLKSGASAEETRMALEDLNLGRLRIASKGVTRHPRFGTDPAAPKLVEIQKTEQVSQGMYMIGQVAALRGSVCTIAALHRDVAVEGSKKLEGLRERFPEVPTQRPAQAPSDVAIVGMACILPKAPDLETFWENILCKVDAISEIPKERWNSDLYFDSDPKAKDKIYSKWGGFIDDVAFDPVQYGMPPASLRSIEPVQLLTLEVVRAALKDAGYLDRPFARERTSVILGAGGGAADLGLAYGARSFMPVLEDLPEFRGRTSEIVDRLDGRLPEWTEDSFAGILANVSAGRVANRFDLGGSNFTVDAACASSLAAVSLALKELECHTSDMVIVGGIDTMQNPFTYLCFSKTHALSPRGRCRTFDESADGIAISEGIAMMVFKRLADAERDGDRIYAVIKGAGSSSDGKDRGLTAPRPEGQARALNRAYAKAGLSPATVGLIEAHGTGTVAGDGAEVQALTQVFSDARAPLQSCAIGSVKSMVGHTKCSAGAVGLVKAALALHHKVLPPTLGVEKPNPRARFPETPFFVNTEAQAWLNGLAQNPRRAGVSAFGFGGTNFHVVVEEYTGTPASAQPTRTRQWSDELFVWRAENRQALLQTVETWDEALRVPTAPILRDLAFTAWKQAEELSAGARKSALQLAIVASSVDDLKQKLASARKSLVQSEVARISDPRGIYFSQEPLGSQGKVAFLFPGQGSQYPHMLQDLLIYFPEMQEVFESANAALGERLEKPLSSYVFPPPSFNTQEADNRQCALTETHIAQPALGAAGLAMSGLLGELGLKPDMVAGHSYGEYVALAAAGAFSPETLIAISEARGRFIVDAAGGEPGVMAAIEADAVTVAAVVDGIQGVCIANANAPRQIVISGTKAGVEEALKQFGARGTSVRRIPVACAFHSPTVSGAQQGLAQFLSGVKVGTPTIPVYSNTTAEPYPTEPDAIVTRLLEHLVRPVEFAREIESMYDAGARIFVEAGPRGVLTGLVDKILGDRPKLAVASNQSGRPGLTQVLHLLAQLAAQGVSVKLDRLYRGRSSRRLDLGALGQDNEKQLSPSVWLVNGARAKPLKEVAGRNGRANGSQKMDSSKHPKESTAGLSVPPIPAPVNGSAAASHQGAAPPSPPPVQPSPVVLNGSHEPAPAVTRSLDNVSHVVVHFQQIMTRFLDVQQTVMINYLEGQSTPSTLEPALRELAPRPQAEPTRDLFALQHFVAAEPLIPQPVTQPEIAVSAAPVAAHALKSTPGPLPSEKSAGKTDPATELTKRLLTIVSDRTGYPPEMLDLQLDLEADLGIDSIKRVEILGTFQQSFAEMGINAGEGLMEGLSGIRTLQGVIDRVAEQIGAEAPTSVSSAEMSVPKAGAPSREQLTARLLATVSDRTGYPPEMLDVDADMEADLGIDSIKRVEILGNFQQALFELGQATHEGMIEQLAGMHTLRGIIDCVLQVAQKKPVSGDSEPATADKSDEHFRATAGVSTSNDHKRETANIGRFTLAAVERPLAGALQPVAKDRTVLITDDGRGIATALGEELHRRGHHVVTVAMGERVQERASGFYEADLGSPEAVNQLISLVNERQGAIGAIVHLYPLANRPSPRNLALEDSSQKLMVGTKSLFYLAKAAGKQLREAGQNKGASLIAATGMGGAFMTGLSPDSPVSYPDHGGIAGLTKTLAIEWPEVRIRVVDLNPEENGQDLADHLLGEMNVAEEGHTEIGYQGARRLCLDLNLTAPERKGKPALAIDSSSVVLVTGGARGIGARAAHRIAERYGSTIVLIGRTPMPEAQESAETSQLSSPKELKAALMESMRRGGDQVTPARVEQAYARLMSEREIRQNLKELRKLGGAVHYETVDVRDAEAFASVIDSIYERFGRLDGVIHAAGVIEDKLVQDKTVESFDRVFDTKVNSAFTLTRKLHSESLQFLVFFTSVAGRFGNRGQGDYAAANEVLNKLAVSLDRSWPGRVVAMNWGPWDSPGMVSEEVRRQFVERGVELIPPEVGLQMLEDELNFGHRGEAEVVIGGAGWSPVKQHAESFGDWPLLPRISSSGVNGTREFVCELDPVHDRYLDDHRIDGRPVLPLAVASELMAEVVAQNWPELQFTSIRDLQLLKGIVLDKEHGNIRIVSKSQSVSEPNKTSVAVELVSAEQPYRVHYRATVELAQGLPQTPPREPVLLSDGGAFRLTREDFYNQWLFHGPLLQGISRIESIGPSGITALLARSRPSDLVAGDPKRPWLIDPLMFDSALQLLVVWAREHWDMTALPSGFQSYSRFGEPSSGPVLCEMRIRPNTGSQTIHADIFFIDAATRRVFAVLDDMQGACSTALNRLARKSMTAAVGLGS